MCIVFSHELLIKTTYFKHLYQMSSPTIFTRSQQMSWHLPIVSFTIVMSYEAIVSRFNPLSLTTDFISDIASVLCYFVLILNEAFNTN